MRVPRVFKPSNMSKGMRGYVEDSKGVRHQKSGKRGTQKRRSGKQHHKTTGGPIGISVPTIRRKKRKGLFGLW